METTVVEVPVPVPTEAVLEAATEAAEVAAANAETDEDYKWLTDRLDALCAENRQLRELVQELTNSNREQLRVNQEQAAETNRTQARMIEMLTAHLTSLSTTAQQTASESLRLTQQNLTTTSQETQPEAETVTEAEIVAEAEPANVAPTPVAPAAKKRPRI